MVPGKALGWIFCCFKPEQETGRTQRQGSEATLLAACRTTDAPPPPLNNYFALMLQHISDPVALFTRNGTLLANNAASEALFDRMRAAAGSCRPAPPSLRLLFTADPDALQEAMADIAAGRTWRGLIQVTDSRPPPAPAETSKKEAANMLLTAASGRLSQQCSLASSCAMPSLLQPPPQTAGAAAPGASGSGAPWTAHDMASLRLQLQLLQPERAGHGSDAYGNPRDCYSHHCPSSSGALPAYHVLHGPPLVAPQQQQHLMQTPLRIAHSLSLPSASRTAGAAATDAAGSGSAAAEVLAPDRRVSSETGAAPGRAGQRRGAAGPARHYSAAAVASRSGGVGCPSERPGELLVDVLTSGGGGGQSVVRGGGSQLANSAVAPVQAATVMEADTAAGSGASAADLELHQHLFSRGSVGPAGRAGGQASCDHSVGSSTWASAAAATAAAMTGSSSAAAPPSVPLEGGRRRGDAGSQQQQQQQKQQKQMPQTQERQQQKQQQQLLLPQTQAQERDQEQGSQHHRPSRFGTSYAAGTSSPTSPAAGVPQARAVAEEPKGPVSVSALWDWKAARSALRSRGRRASVEVPSSAAASYTTGGNATATAAAANSSPSAGVLQSPRRASLDEDASFRPRWAALDTTTSHHNSQQTHISRRVQAVAPAAGSTTSKASRAGGHRMSMDVPAGSAVAKLAVPGFGRTSLPRTCGAGGACGGSGLVGSRGSNSGVSGATTAGRTAPLIDVRSFLRQAEKDYAGAAAAVAKPSAAAAQAAVGGAGVSAATAAPLMGSSGAVGVRTRGPSQLPPEQQPQQTPQRKEPPPPPPPSQEWQAATRTGGLRQPDTHSGVSQARAAAAAGGSPAAAAAPPPVHNADGQRARSQSPAADWSRDALLASVVSGDAGNEAGVTTAGPQHALLRLPSLTGGPLTVSAGSFRAGATGGAAIAAAGCGSPSSASGRRSLSPLSRQSRSAHCGTVGEEPPLPQDQQHHEQEEQLEQQEQQHGMEGLGSRAPGAVLGEADATTAARAAVAARERELQEQEMFAAEKRLLAASVLACEAINSSPGTAQPQHVAQDGATGESQSHKDELPGDVGGSPSQCRPAADIGVLSNRTLPQLRANPTHAAVPIRADPPDLAPAWGLPSVCVVLEAAAPMLQVGSRYSLHVGSVAGGGGGGPIALAAAAAATASGSAAARRRSSWCAGTTAVAGDAAGGAAGDAAGDAAAGAATSGASQGLARHHVRSSGSPHPPHHVTATARRMLFPLGPDQQIGACQQLCDSHPSLPSAEGPHTQSTAAAASAGGGAAAANALGAAVAAAAAAASTDFQCDKLSYASWADHGTGAHTSGNTISAVLGNSNSLELPFGGVAHSATSASGNALTAESLALVVSCRARPAAAEQSNSSLANARAPAAGGVSGGVASGDEAQPQAASVGQVSSHGGRRKLEVPAAAAGTGGQSGEAALAAAMNVREAASTVGGLAVTGAVDCARTSPVVQQDALPRGPADGCGSNDSRARRMSCNRGSACRPSLLSAALAGNDGGVCGSARGAPASRSLQDGSSSSAAGGGSRSMHQAGSYAHGGSHGSAEGSSMNEPSFNAGLAPLPGGSPAAPPDTTGGGATAAQAGGRPAAANAATGAPGRSASLAVSSAFALISSANLPDSVAPLSASTRRGQRYYAAGGNADAAAGVPTAASASSDASLARSPAGGQQPRSLRLPPSPRAHLLSAAEAAHPAGGVAGGPEVPSSSSGRVQHVAAARTPLSRSKSGVGNSGHFVTTYASGGAAAARAAAVAGGVSGSPPAVFGWTASGAGGLADTDPAILASLEQQQLMQLMQHQQQYIQQLHQRQQLQQLQRQQHQEALMQGLSTSAFGAARRGARTAAANRASCAGSVASGGAAAGGTVAMARAGGGAAAVSAAHAGASARDKDVSVGGSVARRQSTCIGVGAAAYQHQQQAAAGAVASGMLGSRALHHSGVGGLPAGSLYATDAASVGGGGGGGGRRTRSVENLMLVSNGSDDFCSMESTAAAASARSKPLPPPQPGSRTVHFPVSRAAAAGAGGAGADAPAVRSSAAMTSVRSGDLSSAAGFVLPRPNCDAAGQASSRAAAWNTVGALPPTSGTAREALSMNGAGPASPRSSRGKNFLARSLARLTSLAKMGGGASGSTGPGAISGMGYGGTSSGNQQHRSGLHRSPALSDGQVMLSNELLSAMAGVTSVDQAAEASRTFGGNSVDGAAAAGPAAGTGLEVVAAAAAAAAAAGMALEPTHRHASVSWNHLTHAASGPLGAATVEVPQQPPPELWTFAPPAAKNSGSSGIMPMSSPRTTASGKGAAARNFGGSFNANAGHGVGSVSDLPAVVSGKLSVPVSALSAAGRQRPVLNTASLMAAAAVDPFAGVALDAVDGPVADVASKSPRVIASPLPQHLSTATAAACPSPAAMFRGSSGGAGGGGGGGHTSPLPLHLGSHPSPPPPTPPAAGLAVPRIVQLTMRSMARAGAAGVTGGTSALGGARWAASNGTGGGNSTNHASGPLSSLAAAALLESVGDRMPSALMHTYATGLCDDALGVGSATGGLAGAPVTGRFMSSSNVINHSAFHTCGDVVIREAAAAAGGEEDAAAVADLVADVSIRGGIHGSVGASPRAGASAGLSGSFGSALHGHAGSSAVLLPPVIASSAGILTTTASCNSNQHVMLQHHSGHSALGALSTTATDLGRVDGSSAVTLMQQQDLHQHQRQAADGANSRSCSPQKDGRDAETQLLAGHSGSWRNNGRAGGGGGGGMGEATGGQDSGAQQTGGTMRSFASTPEAVGVADGSPAHAVDVRGAQDGRASRPRRQVDHGSGGGGGGGGTLAVSSYASAGAGAAAAAASGLLSAEMLTAGAAAGNGRGGGKMAGMLVVTRCGSHSATSTASAAMSTVALPPPAGLQLAPDTAAASFSVDTAVGGGGAADATAEVGSVFGGGGGGLGTEGGSWYELTVSAVPHPTSPGEFLIMVVQHDVSARVWAERQLARVVEAEHALLEAIFPAHVLEHIAVATMDAALRGGGAARTGPATQQQGSGAGTVGAPVAAVSGPLHITGDTFIHLATNHSMITVLFCDIQGFTGMCNSVRPGVVMAFLNDLFTRLDALLDAFGVYKVETIGDCYMVAGGLMKVDEETGAVTVRSDDVDPLHAYRTVQFAKALLQAAGAVRLPTTGEPVRLRVGIHSGSAMSGVVGTRMPRFCLFGDTVNTASRMESTGEAGAIHVSKAVFDLVPGEEWEPTGGVQAKGKGQLETYLLRPAMEEHGDAEATVPKL